MPQTTPIPAAGQPSAAQILTYLRRLHGNPNWRARCSGREVRVLDALLVLALADGTARVPDRRDLAASVGVHKNAIYSILHTLCELGLIADRGDGAYALAGFPVSAGAERSAGADDGNYPVSAGAVEKSAGATRASTGRVGAPAPSFSAAAVTENQTAEWTKTDSAKVGVLTAHGCAADDARQIVRRHPNRLLWDYQRLATVYSLKHKATGVRNPGGWWHMALAENYPTPSEIPDKAALRKDEHLRSRGVTGHAYRRRMGEDDLGAMPVPERPAEPAGGGLPARWERLSAESRADALRRLRARYALQSHLVERIDAVLCGTAEVSAAMAQAACEAYSQTN